MNTIDLFLDNTLLVTWIIDTGHSLITLLFIFKLNHYKIHVVYLNTKAVGAKQNPSILNQWNCNYLNSNIIPFLIYNI